MITLNKDDEFTHKELLIEVDYKSFCKFANSIRNLYEDSYNFPFFRLENNYVIFANRKFILRKKIANKPNNPFIYDIDYFDFKFNEKLNQDTLKIFKVNYNSNDFISLLINNQYYLLDILNDSFFPQKIYDYLGTDLKDSKFIYIIVKDFQRVLKTFNRNFFYITFDNDNGNLFYVFGDSKYIYKVYPENKIEFNSKFTVETDFIRAIIENCDNFYIHYDLANKLKHKVIVSLIDDYLTAIFM